MQAAIARLHDLRAVLPLLVPYEAIAISRRISWQTPANMAIQLKDLAPAR